MTDKCAVPKIAGLLLAGGRSIRMGKDKALLSYHANNQLRFLYNLLGKTFENTFVSINQEQISNSEYASFNHIVDLPDFNFKGPLCGILSAMKTLPQYSWLVVACDLPFVTQETLMTLIRERNPKMIATCFVSEHDSMPEPLCAIYEQDSFAALARHAKEGLFCPRKILIKENPHLLPLNVPKTLDNINTEEEYRQAKKLLQKNT